MFHVANLRKPFGFLFIILSSYPGVIVSVNFTVLSWRQGEKIIMDMAHNSNRVNSLFFSSSSPFCGMRNRQRHGANLRPIVGLAIVGLMKGAFKSLFLLNCFVSAFQRCILSAALHETISGDETLFCHSSPSRWAILRRWIVCMSVCVCVLGEKQCPSFCPIQEHKGV